MTKKPSKPSRSPRRVQWEPESPPRTDVDDENIDTLAEDYADRIPSTEEQLKQDKPPHWS